MLGLEVLVYVSVVVLHIYSAVRMDARHLAFVVLCRRLAPEARLALVALAKLPSALRTARPVRRRRARPVTALLLRAAIVALRPAPAAALRPRHGDELLVHVGLDLAVVILDRKRTVLVF